MVAKLDKVPAAQRALSESRTAGSENAQALMNEIRSLQTQLKNLASAARNHVRVYCLGNVTTVAGASGPDFIQEVEIAGVRKGMMSKVESCGSGSPAVLNSVCDDGKVILKFAADPGAGKVIKLWILAGNTLPQDFEAALP